MNNIGRFVASQYLAPSQPIQITTGSNWEYIRIINNSPYLLSVTFSGAGTIDFPEMYLEDIRVPCGYTGTLTIAPGVNVTNTSQAISNLITVNAYAPGEIISPQTQPLQQQAVNVTASGKPLFSATIGFGATATKYQTLNIYNPANSGVTYIFHAAKCVTNDATLPAVNLVVLPGNDLNLPTAVAASSHTGSANPPTSTAHCTAEDAVTGHGGTIIEVENMPQNTTEDLLAFPDNYTLYPGCNLYMQLTSGTAGHVVRLTFKWTDVTTQ